jgi:hypothetical protein
MHRARLVVFLEQATLTRIQKSARTAGVSVSTWARLRLETAVQEGR